jgi:hypothetical protein
VGVGRRDGATGCSAIFDKSKAFRPACFAGAFGEYLFSKAKKGTKKRFLKSKSHALLSRKQLGSGGWPLRLAGFAIARLVAWCPGGFPKVALGGIGGLALGIGYTAREARAGLLGWKSSLHLEETDESGQPAKSPLPKSGRPRAVYAQRPSNPPGNPTGSEQRRSWHSGATEEFRSCARSGVF